MIKKYIFIGREMLRDKMVAAYVLDRENNVRIKLTMNEFNRLGSQMLNCVVVNGCIREVNGFSLANIPTYDGNTGRMICGMSEKNFINIINKRAVTLVSRLLYDENVIGYIVKDSQGNTKRYNINQIRSLNNLGFIKNEENINDIRVDRHGNEIKDFEDSSDFEGNLEENSDFGENSSFEGREVAGYLVENFGGSSLTDRGFRYDVVRIILCKLTNVESCYVLYDNDSLEEINVAVDKYNEYISETNPDKSKTEKIYRNNRNDILFWIDDYFRKNSLDRKLKSKLIENIDFKKVEFIGEEQLKGYIDAHIDRIKAGEYYRVSSVVYKIDWRGIKVKFIELIKDNEKYRVEPQVYKSLYAKDLIFGASYGELENNWYTLDASYKIYYTGVIDKVVHKICDEYDSKLGSYTYNKIISTIESTLGIDSLGNINNMISIASIRELVLEVIKDTIKSDITLLKNRYEHCISEFDIKGARKELVKNMTSNCGGVYSGCNIKALRLEIVPMSSGIVISDIYYNDKDKVRYIRIRNNYFVVNAGITWIDLISSILVQVAIVYGGKLHVRVKKGNDVWIDGGVSVSCKYTLGVRNHLEKQDMSIRDIESMLYNHIDSELIQCVGKSDAGINLEDIKYRLFRG